MGTHRIALGAALLIAAAGLPGWAQSAPAPAAGGAPATGPSTTPEANPGGQPPANAREQQLLDRIRQLKAPRWRSYGVCRYDWSAWRLSDGTVRTTDAECGPDNSRTVVAVHCDTLQVSRREGDGPWTPWRLPLSLAESKTSGGEDLMVAALCANLRPTAESPSSPTPLTTVPNGAAKPASSKPAGSKPAATKPAAARPAATTPGARAGSSR